MSQTFTIATDPLDRNRENKGAVLSADFSTPIELDPRYDYALALINFSTYNSIPNIEEGVNNKLYYWELADRTKEKVISIPTGSYEIHDIETYLQSKIIPKGVKDPNDHFSLKPNNNTLKCEIKSKHEINFAPTDSLASLLGYSARELKPDILHQSDLPVRIVKVISIHIDCNITTGAFYNNIPSHTIFQFAPSVSPGYRINIKPSTRTYLPIINKRAINNITLRILDQNCELVNFRGEEISVTLELKKIWA